MGLRLKYYQKEQGQGHECFVDENASGHRFYYEGFTGNKD
jgi:hypothetical protein